MCKDLSGDVNRDDRVKNVKITFCKHCMFMYTIASGLQCEDGHGVKEIFI